MPKEVYVLEALTLQMPKVACSGMPETAKKHRIDADTLPGALCEQMYACPMIVKNECRQLLVALGHKYACSMIAKDDCKHLAECSW